LSDLILDEIGLDLMKLSALQNRFEQIKDIESFVHINRREIPAYSIGLKHLPFYFQSDALKMAIKTGQIPH